MKVVINPKYSHLEPFINSILERNYKVDATYRNRRNTVEEVTVDGQKLIVKIFKKPTEANRVVYTLLRPTKAKRSYEISFKLLELGYKVPDPVAYIEKKKGLFFHTGCYVSLYTDYRPITDFYDVKEISDFNQYCKMKRFISDFANFSAEFHSNGLIHNDYNIDNILYKEIDGKNQFLLIDLNRVKFGNKSLAKSAKDLSNLRFNPTIMASILQQYSEARGLDLTKVAKEVLAKSAKGKTMHNIKHSLLKLIGLKK